MSDASQICRMCLRNGGKLFNLNHFNLKDIYLETTGIQLKNQEYMLPQNSCNICIHLLQKMAIFSKQCQDADDILNKLILNGHVITAESIKHQNVCINVYSNLEIAKQVNWDYLPVWSDTYEDVEVIKSEDDPITNSDAKISRTGTQITSLTSGVSQSVSGTISDTASDHDELVTFFDYKTEVKVEPKEDRKKGRRRRKEKKDGGVVKIKKKKVKPSPSKTAPIAEQKIKIEKDFSPKPEPVDEDYSDNDEKTLAEMVVARPNSVKKRGPAEKNTMALTASERMKRYREKLKKNKIKYEEVKKKHAERVKARSKKVSELSSEEKEDRRKTWREQKQRQMEKKKKIKGEIL